MLEELEKRLLNDVFGLALITQHAPAEPIDRTAVLIEEPEGLRRRIGYRTS